jgi:polysaccharide pyruvyl transferase WcaK-like protein
VKKKILISGSYGTGNVGDEVILERLLQQFSGHDLTVLSQGCSYTQKFFQGIEVIDQTPSWRPIRILKDIVKCRFSQIRSRINFLNALRRADVFVVGGGGLFAELVPQVLEFYLHQIKWAKFLGTKVLVLGVGVGPLRTSKGKANLGRTFNRCVSGVLVRDEQSFDNLMSVGVDVKVNVCPDFAFLGKQHESEKVTVDSRKKKVILNLYSVFSDSSIWENAEIRHESFVDTMNKTIDYLLKENFEVELLPFGTKSDLDFCKKLAARFTGDISVFEGVDYKSIQERFIGAYFSISMRFHAGVLSFLHGTPSLCIDQQFKSERLLMDMNLGNLLLSLPDGFHKKGSEDLEIDSVLKAIEDLIDNRMSTMDVAARYYEKKRGEAQKLLDSFLIEHDLRSGK